MDFTSASLKILNLQNCFILLSDLPAADQEGEPKFCDMYI